MNDSCELPARNATPEEILEILKSARRIAVVGHSERPDRDSYRVGRYLAEQGYEVFPVNPRAKSTSELRFYPDLASVPGRIDVVDIFRKPEELGAIVDEAIRLGAGAVWMQDGLADNAAADRARAAGLRVVMSHCMMRDHRALLGS
jgi:predicted CoA-binding protein